MRGRLPYRRFYLLNYIEEEVVGYYDYQINACSQTRLSLSSQLNPFYPIALPLITNKVPTGIINRFVCSGRIGSKAERIFPAEG